MGADGEAAAAGGSGSGAVTVHIRCSNGTKFSVEADSQSAVGAFKAQLAGTCDVPADQQRLIYKGRILKDEQTLASYGVESDHTIHLVRGAAPSTALATATTGAARNINSASGIPRDHPSESRDLGGATFGGSLFPALGVNGLGGSGTSGLFGTGIPELDQMQQQLTQNPNVMREIMNMPAIQNLMNNPEILRNLIMNNPQMREIIDRNPELAHVLNDPSTLRQTLEAVRNPELMREMMRNTDRAMSNIESSPEGFNMLRRMYETVQEPFLNATTMAGDTGNGSGSNPFTALLGNQGADPSRDQLEPSTNSSNPSSGSPAPNTNPLPNPWSNTTGGAQPTNTRSAPTVGARVPGSAGLGGLDLPQLEGAVGGMQDPSLINQVMQNPAMTQMMQNLLSDPQYMDQMLNLNPQTRNLMENTQFREMMQNPEFIRQLTSPDTLQQLLSFQQTLMSQLGQQQPSQGQNQTGGGSGMPNNTGGLELFMNMFGGLGAGGLGVPNTPNVPPEQLYATQLAQLHEMGFFDTQENIRALSATAGNVHVAVERLLGNLGQ
ncbi:ubiquitin domain-containing protein DSK2b-like [Iris pallida]|uniref:Ubiquitin domain-containing protein DSK2b-like n=1 Tax=Iris pallida TaxID=29817 RepID=A0AAX6GNI6_IRIPA|nr:ubiquitin domain-containing protein DSK2b-like [Iris pallida]